MNAFAELDLKMKRGGLVAIDGSKIEVTEDGVALAFTEKHGDFLLYDHDAGCWYEWQGDHWKAEKTGRAFNYCRELARSASDGVSGKERATMRRAAFAFGVEKMAQRDRHPTDLAMLRGARLVSASETEEGRAWAEARIKQMTGGDPITARFMRQDFFTYQPQFKLTIVGNHQPVLHNVDDAARRRFNIIPFTRKPDAPDNALEIKLKDEWPGILRWMIDGCLGWSQNGLQRPQSVVDATAAYFSDQDFIGQWLDDCCIVEPGNHSRWETSADLFKSWSDYAKAAGEEAGTQKALAGKLNRHGLKRDQKKYHGRNNKVWLGVNIKQQEVSHEY